MATANTVGVTFLAFNAILYAISVIQTGYSFEIICSIAAAFVCSRLMKPWTSTAWRIRQAAARNHFHKANCNVDPRFWCIVGCYSFLISDDEAENLADEWDYYVDADSETPKSVILFFVQHLTRSFIRPLLLRFKSLLKREKEFAVNMPEATTNEPPSSVGSGFHLSMCFLIVVFAFLHVDLFIREFWPRLSHLIAESPT